MTQEHQESIKEIRELYITLTPKDGEPCTYCGSLSTDKEHVTPRVWIERAQTLSDMGLDIEVPDEVIVPACSECNLIASGRIFKNLADKKMFIRWRLAIKYKKWIALKQWEDDELEELSGNFRKQTVLYNEVLKAIQRRLRFINANKLLEHSEYFKARFG